MLCFFGKAYCQSPKVSQGPIFGFTAADPKSPGSAQAEHRWEGHFDGYLNAGEQDIFMRRLSAHPHHVGSPWGKKNALYLDSLYASWGYQTRIDTFYVLFPTVKERQLELLSPGYFKAGLKETPLAEDPTSSQVAEQLPVFNAFSRSGDVTGSLVYVNRGLPADYLELDRMGVSVKGKLVIARYGGSWRGIKPKVAAEHGAIGCIIYSDPRDDGYFQGDMYPKGPFKNPTMAQRGSVSDMPLYPGDPSTPGKPSTAGAEHLSWQQSPTITKIPVLPVSYADAQPLLAALEGPIAPESWRGALPFTYHIGGNKILVHLKLDFEYGLKQIYNVVATTKGSLYPDEWIIRGNHHDGWVNGADDPLSGQVAMLNEAHGISICIKQGFKPLRTIMYCSWDGEEPGLLGSTEFVEKYTDELSSHTIAYLNSDGNGRGFLGAGGSHTLQKYFNEISSEVIDPQKHVSVEARLRALHAVSSTPEIKKEAIEGLPLRLSALGSGSDYSPFLQHTGIASLNVGFGGEDEGGEYHSIFDSYANFTRFKDPGYAYGLTLAKVMGRCVMRLSQANVLPFDLPSLSETLKTYVAEIKKLADTMRTSTDSFNKSVNKGYYALAEDPDLHKEPLKQKELVPALDFSLLDDASNALDKRSITFAKRLSTAGQGVNDAARVQRINQWLIHSERSFLLSEGLPRRPWYRHALYAPGYYTGYGVKTLPSIREAIEQHNWKEAKDQIAIVTALLTKFTESIP